MSSVMSFVLYFSVGAFALGVLVAHDRAQLDDVRAVDLHDIARTLGQVVDAHDGHLGRGLLLELAQRLVLRRHLAGQGRQRRRAAHSHRGQCLGELLVRKGMPRGTEVADMENSLVQELPRSSPRAAAKP
jgi:hypothetical protein